MTLIFSRRQAKGEPNSGTRRRQGRQRAKSSHGLATVQCADADGNGGNLIAAQAGGLEGSIDKLATQRSDGAAGAREGVPIA